jgi:hypothetical protein
MPTAKTKVRRKTAKKRKAKPEGVLADTARAIGSTLGALSAKSQSLGAKAKASLSDLHMPNMPNMPKMPTIHIPGFDRKKSPKR